jgi:hypothetical protein
MTDYEFKLWISSMAVGPFPHAFTFPRKGRSVHPCCIFLDLFLPIFGRRLAISRSSHVRPLSPFRVTSICPDQVLTDAASIAIWNRHKVVIATSIIIWGTGVTFHING